MEAQLAHQPTSPTYARPRQPADSPVAALPTETLVRILELALEEEEDPFERQCMTWSFQKVSWQWSAAVGEQREYALEHQEQVAGLVKALSSSGRDGEVQSLALPIQLLDESPAHAKTQLLRLCSSLKKLEVQCAGGFDLDYGDEEALEAARGLKEVQEVVFIGALPLLTLQRSVSRRHSSPPKSES